MIFLVWSKLKVGKKLNSEPLIADARCTLVCISMSLTLLAASAIYEFTRFSYADAIGTFVLAWFSFTEGKECFEKAENGKCSCEAHPELE
jgi:divalent metal cation (Fe/Co/Zn/Cd) transporter